MSKYIFLVAATIALFATACSDGNTLEFERGRVAYSSSVTRFTAARLGQFIDETPLLAGREGLWVKLKKYGYNYQLEWKIEPGFLPHPDTLSRFQVLVDSISENVLRGRDLSLRFTNWRDQGFPVNDGSVYHFLEEDGLITYHESDLAEEAKYVSRAAREAFLEIDPQNYLLSLSNTHGQNRHLKLAILVRNPGEMAAFRPPATTLLENLTENTGEAEKAPPADFSHLYMILTGPLGKDVYEEVTLSLPAVQKANELKVGEMLIRFTDKIDWGTAIRFSRALQRVDSVPAAEVYNLTVVDERLTVSYVVPSPGMLSSGRAFGEALLRQLSQDRNRLDIEVLHKESGDSRLFQIQR